MSWQNRIKTKTIKVTSIPECVWAIFFFRRNQTSNRKTTISRIQSKVGFTQNGVSFPAYKYVSRCWRKQWSTQEDFLITLNDSPYFKKSLQVVNLSECHCHQNQSFKEGPKHHSAVCVVIDWNKKRECVNTHPNYRSIQALPSNSLALCILSRTSMYSCSCFTAVMATANSLIISSNLFWWAEKDKYIITK